MADPLPDIYFDDNIRYEDMDEPLPVELHMIGGWICIKTPLERKTVNITELRYDSTPRNVLNYVINEKPNKEVSLDELKLVGFSTSRDLRQIAIKAGIKGYVRDLFMPIRSKDRIKVINRVLLSPAEAEELIESLYY